MPYTFDVPYATQVQLQQRNGWATCRNLSLLLHHYVPHEIIVRAVIDDRSGKKSAKSQWLAELAARSRSTSQPLFDPDLHSAWVRRWIKLADAHRAIRFRAKCSWRMVVGLGEQSLAETDLLVHPIYGLPYVPGSALKGLTRAYMQFEGGGDDGDAISNNSTTGEPSSLMTRIFGTQQESGAVIFFDAIPANTEPLQLDVDVMNPHYPDYYRDSTGKHPPSDDQKPIPVHFLTVGRATFHFAVAPGDRSTTQDDAHLAATWLKQALRDYGVGAKTNAGYGRFVMPDSGD